MEVLAEETDKTADPQQINFVSAKVTLRSGDKSYGPFFVSNRFEFEACSWQVETYLSYFPPQYEIGNE